MAELETLPKPDTIETSPLATTVMVPLAVAVPVQVMSEPCSSMCVFDVSAASVAPAFSTASGPSMAVSLMPLVEPPAETSVANKPPFAVMLIAPSGAEAERTRKPVLCSPTPSASVSVMEP